ncbi:hypothetical protein [Embleya scabrispora]|uniref:hypothetical protein n=1 Tax=Embleya scabrispora TaxID=159449 RepID=UPI00037EB72C|nr:hypothetical protein [Embleya scabrispora]MYS82761.1 hypothetical protein [Streptomyces sp. SID5474]
MIVTEQQDDRVCVTESGDPRRPIRVKAPDRAPLDMTHDELVALQHEIRAYLLYPVPGPPLRRMSNSGG